MKYALKKILRVAVLVGGSSSERDVSRRTGEMVVKALPKFFKTKIYDPSKNLGHLVSDCRQGKIDVVFNALHGRGGEDGSIQGLLDLLRVPYTGSGLLASALAMDKWMAKRVYTAAGLPTPPAILVTSEAWKWSPDVILASIRRQVGDRVVVKPNASGSSVGITVTPKVKEIGKAIRVALREDASCLVERFRKGRELTVGVLGLNELEALPVVEIRTKRAFFDYRAKYTTGGHEDLCPAPIPPHVTKEAQALGIASHIALGCRGYSRTDMIWHEKGIDVLETNTLPGLTDVSLFPKAASVAGIAFPDLLSRLIGFAMSGTHRR